VIAEKVDDTKLPEFSYKNNLFWRAFVSQGMASLFLAAPQFQSEKV
jgi:hypothetical protein